MGELTTILATTGAILGIINIVWSIYRDLTDRGRLRVGWFIGHLIGPGVHDARPKLMYTVTNVGRRPIMVTQIGGGQGKEHFLIVPRTGTLPRMLAPSEYLNDWAEDPVGVLLHRDGLKFLAAWDSLGRVYRVPKRRVKKLIAEAKEMQAKGSSRGHP